VNPDEAPTRTQSGEMPALKGDLKATQTHVEAAMKRGLFLSDLKAGAMTVVGILAGGYAALHAIDGRAQDKVDAGVTSVREVTEEKFKAIEQRLDRTDKQADRMEQKLDKVLEGLRLPNPAPAPKDAGR